MAKRKKFPAKVADKALLWCARHCCVCGQQCGVDIETHHIDPDGQDNLDNCLPVCYTCHGKLSHYDPKQPRGRKFQPDELRKRREQVYDNYTSHLVPPTDFGIHADPRGLPYARFTARNLGSYPPVQAWIRLTPYVDGKKRRVVQRLHYNGKTPVNLNPQHGFDGWFKLPGSCREYKKRLLVRVDVIIIDPYAREHPLLPFGFVHVQKQGDDDEQWYYEPSPECPEVLAGSQSD